MESTENKLPTLKLPRQSEVVQRLASVLAFNIREGIAECDVRLQVFHSDASSGDAWELHSGSADFDTDHRGYWGASSVSRETDLWSVAREIIEQAAEHAAQNGREIEEGGATYSHHAKRGEWWEIRSDDGGRSFDRLRVLLKGRPTIAQSPVQVREAAEQRRRNKEAKRIQRMRELRAELAKVSTSDEMEEHANDVLRADYFGHVRSLAQEMADRVRSEIEGGTLFEDVDTSGILHEIIDSSAMVIYTAQNFQVLRYCENHDAYTDEMGEAPTDGQTLNWAALAFSALQHDVNEQFQRVHADDVREGVPSED